MKYTFISLYFLQSILSVKYTEKYTLECSKFSILLVYFFNVLYVYFKYTFFFKKVYLKYILSVQTKYTWNILFFCVGGELTFWALAQQLWRARHSKRQHALNTPNGGENLFWSCDVLWVAYVYSLWIIT